MWYVRNYGRRGPEVAGEEAMRAAVRLGLAGLIAALAGPAAAADPTDPDWPCVQRKVPELSIGQMWAGPLPDDAWKKNAEVKELARHLVPRRVTPEELAAEAETYAATLAPDARAEGLADLFAAVLQRINAERGQVIAGIGRYARHQQEIGARIEAREDEIAKLQQVPDDQKDWDRIEELQDALAWDTRVFKERAQALTYVCETPVQLEQRAFAIARTLGGLL
jgi:hypothetical protein